MPPNRLLHSIPFLPLLRRRLFFPAWLAKNGSRQLVRMREYERMQYWSDAAVRELQARALGEILRHCAATVPYYQDLFRRVGFDPAGFKDPAQLERIPVLTKEDIRANAERLVSVPYRDRPLFTFTTGGSTGKALTTRGDRDYLDRGVGYFLMCLRWAGWRIGEPMGRVWGNPPLPTRMIHRVRDHLVQPVIWLDTVNLNEQSVREFVRQWGVVRPSLLHGHAHSLFKLAQYCLASGDATIRPRGVIATSMMLLPRERKVIEDTFLAPVHNLYGCEEVGLIACECPRGGFHINVFGNHVEILSDGGAPARAGQEGRIVVTGLHNRAMPLIRYSIEDVGAISAERCACGRAMPVLEKLVGRVADFLVKRDGSLVQGISLIERTLTSIPGLAQMQIVQESLDHFRVNLVRGDGFEQRAEEGLRSALEEVFGGGLRVDFAYLERIMPEPSGKYRFSICRIGGGR